MMMVRVVLVLLAAMMAGGLIGCENATTDPDTAPSFGGQTIADQTYTVGTPITPLTLPAASGGLSYSLTPTVPGLGFSSAARSLFGTPTTAGTYAMTYTATDDDGDAAEVQFNIAVEAPDPPDPPDPPDTVGPACVFPTYPDPPAGGFADVGLNWCPASVSLQIRSQAIAAEADWCGYKAGALTLAQASERIRAYCEILDAWERRREPNEPGPCICQDAGWWSELDDPPDDAPDPPDTGPPSFGGQTVADQTYTVGEAITTLTLPAASGGGTVSYSLTPTVPGLTFTAATRTLSGTPTSAGSYAMRYQAVDGDSNTAVSDAASLNFTIVVDPSDTLPSFEIYALTSCGEVFGVSLDGRYKELFDTTIICGDELKLGLDVENGKMYFFGFEHNPGGVPLRRLVQRANFDGSMIETLISVSSDSTLELRGLALDVEGGKMYWSSVSRGITPKLESDTFLYKIHRANLDGSGIEDLVVHDGRRVDNPRDLSPALGYDSPDPTYSRTKHTIALDVVRGKMYWATYGTSYRHGIVPGRNLIPHLIQRANLDGSEVEDFVVIPRRVFDEIDIDFDMAERKIYWTEDDEPKGRISRANLDGSSHEIVLILDDDHIFYPESIAIDDEAGKMYWSGGSSLRRANLDGSEIEEIAIDMESLGSISDIALYLRSP